MISIQDKGFSLAGRLQPGIKKHLQKSICQSYFNNAPAKSGVGIGVLKACAQTILRA